MRVGLEKGLIKKLHPEQREKDRESVTPGEKKKKKIEPEKFMDEAIQKGKIIRKIMIGSKTFNAILDTGSEITLLKMGMQPEGALEEKALTKIRILPAIGPPSIAYLISVEAKLIEDGDEENDNGGAFIVCAVSDALNGDEILLSPADYDVLKRSNNNIKSQNNIIIDTNLLAEGKSTNESDLQESARLANLIETQMMHKYEIKAIQSGQILKTLESFNLQEEEGIDFEKMQREDTSLQKYWDTVGRPDNRHVLMGDTKLLYRTTKISGLTVYQLVIPKEKREMLISMAHQTEFAGHMGTNKTAKRLQVHFWWPKLSAMVAKFIKSCESCQLIARKTKLDRTPIVPFPRTQRARSQVSMDVLGPIRKNSSAQPFYVLSLIDTYSRWPEITVLRCLTSKAIVNALLATFARTSIPDVLLSDNAGDLVGGLNKAVYAALGIKLQNSIPYHPQSNGICERFNSVLKKIIHLTMNEGSGRDWQKKLDILLLGYREAEHAVLGVSPYQMLYGHVGKGPLNTVKNCWTKEIDQQKEKKSVKDYMTDLKQDLEIGARVAEENCTVRQKKYIDKYHEKTQNKSFEIG